jgi:hypothetical protein
VKSGVPLTNKEFLPADPPVATVTRMSRNVRELVRARLSEISARTTHRPPQRTSSGWLRLQPAPGTRRWCAVFAILARNAPPLVSTTDPEMRSPLLAS